MGSRCTSPVPRRSRRCRGSRLFVTAHSVCRSRAHIAVGSHRGGAHPHRRRRHSTRGPARDPAGDPAAQHGARAVLPPGPRADRGRQRRRAPTDLPTGRAGRPPAGPDRGRDATRHQQPAGRSPRIGHGAARQAGDAVLRRRLRRPVHQRAADPAAPRYARDVLRHDGRPRPAELALPRRGPGPRRRRDDDRLPHLGPPPRHKVRG
jgi:hypothetical protein